MPELHFQDLIAKSEQLTNFINSLAESKTNQELNSNISGDDAIRQLNISIKAARRLQPLAALFPIIVDALDGSRKAIHTAMSILPSEHADNLAINLGEHYSHATDLLKKILLLPSSEQ